MGVATTSFMTGWRPRDMFAFLERSAALGAGGVQTALSATDPESLRRLRQRVEGAGMYLEVMASLPQDDASGFAHTAAAAREAGARCLRAACLGGRRYEAFSTLEDWRAFVRQAKAAVRGAVQVCEQRRLPLALENHKDWTAEELLALLREYSSEYLGVCLDTGNNIALLDDPREVVLALAPYAVATHVKDMGVAPDRDGFLLSEVVLGEGALDLRGMLSAIRARRPETRFTLEMITRNPLSVPCLTDGYWATFPDRNGRYLARTLRWVAERQSPSLPRVEGLDAESVRRVEEENVARCLAYARDALGLRA
jgi:sugar phosphate isomerase/epimerase